MSDRADTDTGSRDNPGNPFSFTGEWTEFFPIAITNLLLTIVTLGIYRFWAKARERRYLWSRTRFIDDNFEWTGTGLEMFIGFLIVMLIFIPFLLFIQFGLEALLLRGQWVAAIVGMVAVYGGLLYLIGVGTFRALRYRLSRTWWHGIRGGSDEGGWTYGGKWVGRTVVGFLVFGLLVPWAMTRLWNERWNEMSFGQHRFEAHADTQGLFGRWLLIYAVPLIGVFAVGIGLAGAMGVGGGEAPGAALSLSIFLTLIAVYLLFLLFTLSYYAAFYRRVAETTSIAGIHFRFTARTKDWLKLILGNIALVIVTLGFGLILLAYRNWSFVIRHMDATGDFDIAALVQSATAAPTEAEGLADAFDLGAI